MANVTEILLASGLKTTHPNSVTVKLDAAAPSGGQTVSLSASPGGGMGDFPSSVMIPQGMTEYGRGFTPGTSPGQGTAVVISGGGQTKHTTWED